MAIDFELVGERIAAKFAGVAGIKGSSLRNLDNLPSLPYVVVLTPTLELMERPPSNERWDWLWPCLLFVEQNADQGRAQVALRSLVVPCLYAWQGIVGGTGVKLGLPYVQDSWIARATPDFVAAGEGNIPVMRFDVMTVFRENISREAGPIFP